MYVLKLLILISLILSCANRRQETLVDLKNVAHDSIVSGNISAKATKVTQPHEVCFEVVLKLFGTNRSHALPNNWTMAWIDQNNQYRLLSLNQRNPASSPKGGLILTHFGERQEWANTFKACGSKKDTDSVQAIVLHPKNLPFTTDRSLKLVWQK